VEDERWDVEEDEKEEAIAIPVEEVEEVDKAKPIRSFFRGVKKTTDAADEIVDEAISKTTGTYTRTAIRGRAKSIRVSTGKRLRSLDERSEQFAKSLLKVQVTGGAVRAITKFPKLIVLSVVLISLLTGFVGVFVFQLQENIRGDFEVYLPQGDETAEILDKVNEDWTTDILIIMVETNNSIKDESKRGSMNITERAVLLEMSRVEVALDPYGQLVTEAPVDDEQLDEDGIIFMFSISTILKLLNNSANQFVDALVEEMDIPVDPQRVPGTYSIPTQDNIDDFFNQLPPDARKSIVADTNGDGIYDTAVILVGVAKDADQEKILLKTRCVIGDTENIPDSGGGLFGSGPKDPCEWCKEDIANVTYSTMVATGPIPMTDAITERTYEEMIKVLPAALALVAIALYIFHRNPKIVIIAGIPVMCSLMLTFGIIGISGMTLTPQVTLIAPILVALGVAYGLYIANRYSDEEAIADPNERIGIAITTTGKAVFLSAATTAIGFSSLIFVNMVPMKVLGYGLSMGIMICWAVTMLTVPSLVLIFNYKKKGKVRSRERIGNIPVNHRKKIIMAATMITLISVGMIFSGYVVANMDYLKMSPQDEPVIVKQREYTDKFGGGQLGLILIEGNKVIVDENGNEDVYGSMKDLENVLKPINSFETKINGDPSDPEDDGVENSRALSIVDIMKMVKVPDFTSNEYWLLAYNQNPTQNLVMDWIAKELVNKSFWYAINKVPNTELLFVDDPQQMMINIFYNTLSAEMRGMMVTSDYGKCVIYIDQPSMDVVKTEKAVNEVNEEIERSDLSKKMSPLTGFGAIMVSVNNMLIKNSIQSSIMAIILVFILLAFVFRITKPPLSSKQAVQIALLTIIPVSLIVAWQPIILVFSRNLGEFIDPTNPPFTGQLMPSRPRACPSSRPPSPWSWGSLRYSSSISPPSGSSSSSL